MLIRMEYADDVADRVARRVSSQIKESGVTIAWLCERAGIPRTTLLRRLHGRSAFDLNELERIAGALRIDISALLADVTATAANSTHKAAS